MTALTSIGIDEALTDPQLLGAALGEAETWETWLTVLRAAFGQALGIDEQEVFAELAGGRAPPERRVEEAWFIVGRRSGKSRIAAAVASYLAAFGEHKLAPGETGSVLVLAASKAQARAVFGYIEAFFEESPILRQLVEEKRAEEIVLRGNIVIGVHPNNFRTIRSRTILAAVFDEVAFWRDETSASPDLEVFRAVTPSLEAAGGMLVGISSPYAQRGLLYTKHREHFGKDDEEVLVIQAESRRLNPTLSQERIERARLRDPEATASEWFAEFRGDLSTCVDRLVVEQCVEPGRTERWPSRGLRYVAFADPSGGQRDSFALAIGHREEESVVLDLVREWQAPFSPEDVVEEAARELSEWRVVTIHGDRYAGQWVEDAFRRYGIRYAPTEKNKSALYLEALPLLTSRKAVLLDDSQLINQICQLERRTSRSGRDSVDHPIGTMDDIANAALGCLAYVASEPVRPATPRVVVVEGLDSSNYDVLGW
ncbi:MAG: hypothetical protein OEN23_13880 [Paracoccaceae bacterium]|nr:hypothetical protein [Paracoccaceae bacterium]